MLLRCTLIFVIGIGLVSCKKGPDVSQAEPAQILRIGNGAEPKDLDPAVQASIAEYNIESSLFEGLLQLANDGKTLLPGVAERWEVSDDGLVYTFHLRSNALWSDGSPVTADDFVYGFNRIFLPNMAASNAVMGYMIAGAQEMTAGKQVKLGVEAPDPKTVIVRLKYRAPYILYFFAGAPFMPVPRPVVEKFGGGTQPGTAWTRPENIVSNGPFVLKAWRANEDVIVVRNPKYWDHERMKLTEVRFYPTDDIEAEEHMFRAGQLDATYSLPENKIAVYQRDSPELLHSDELFCTYYLSINLSVAPLSDIRVRRALSLAIDRDRIVPHFTQGEGTAAHSLTRPGAGGYTPRPSKDYDPAEARRLLAEAGYPDGKGFPEFALCASSRDKKILEVIQEVWRKELGIHVSLESQELKTFLDRLYSKNYQIAVDAYNCATNAPEPMLQIMLSDSNWNVTGWSSPDFDKAYKEATDANDDMGRRTAYDRMENALSMDVPVIPLYFRNQIFLVNPKVKGWRDNNITQVDWRELSISK